MLTFALSFKKDPMKAVDKSTKLRIAVQSKGRLQEDTLALLSEAGIRVPSSKRTLLVESSTFPVEVLFLRDDDIPQTVESGVADIGIVGRNELVERGSTVDVVLPLGFSRCRLSLAVPREAEWTGPQWLENRTIATSYPAVLQGWLNEQGVHAHIHVITGSVEVSPGIGLADAIFDIVSSGSTLVQNNLHEVEVVMQSEALLIGHQQMDEDKRALVKELVFRFQAVQAAQGKKYVMMNVPRARLDSVLQVLPGVKSPTVIPLSDADWCAVHTVVQEDSFWHIIGQLRTLGAQDILVTGIEKMIP